MFPAFKEWQVIVEALLAGDQIIILRKGGISEGRGGFSPDRAARFWLFPTTFHAQAEKTKPAAARFSTECAASTDPTITLRAFADVAYHAFVSDWESLARLDTFHFWSDDTVRERFDWAKPAGLHLFIVRVHRLVCPLTLAPTPEMGGCKSWIELPFAFDQHASAPVMSDDAFAAHMTAIKARL